MTDQLGECLNPLPTQKLRRFLDCRVSYHLDFFLRRTLNRSIGDTLWNACWWPVSFYPLEGQPDD